MNYSENLFKNGTLNGELLKKEPWLKYLCITENISTNVERVDTISSITGKETLDYVFRTLNILEKEKENLDDHNYYLLKTVLQWSEVSKGGTKKQREIWESQGLSLDIHNLASAEIYRNHSTDSIRDTKIIYTLIKTHGIIGQFLRGEVSMETNRPLLELKPFFEETEFIDLLTILNKCIIGGVSMDLWKKLEDKIQKSIQNINDGKLTELKPSVRLHCLYDEKVKQETLLIKDILFFDDKIFPYFELWYFTVALSMFTIPEIVKIMEKVLECENLNKVNHLNFKHLSTNLHYDYEGKKHINIYKQRIIEKYLEDDSNENVSLVVKIVNDTAYVDFVFSPACEKLIDFCVEAERSGLLTYEKSITAIFDMFGFRRDEFDRLNNEEKYLNTMNSSENSTKNTIIKYVIGDTVVDVGSGGGVLLDLLESTYPDLKIIGTDISSNVIDVLNEKKEKEGHKWEVQKHNFVDEPIVLFNNGMSIIFSSILHEIFSYTDTPNGKFNIESVKKALKNAYDSMPVGSRIIIRDGIKTDSDDIVTIRFKDEEGMDFFKNFLKDFKGLPEIPESERCTVLNLPTKTVKGNINFMREFLYTYTWGTESYAHEVQEQFGYFTLKEFISFFEELGAEIVNAEEFLEKGYIDHLLPKVDFWDEKGNEIPLPNSNCIVVIEKK